MKRPKKLQPKLALDMNFGELVERLLQTKPSEVEASITRSKQKRPDDPERRRMQKGPAKRRPRRPK